jgi:hypothetical protein
MVEFVGNHKTTLAHQCGNECRVGGEAHGANRRVLRADESGHEGLGKGVQVERATSKPRTAARDTVTLKGFFDSVGASPTGLGKAKIIVGRDVECAGTGAGEDLGVVIVGGDAVEEDDGTAGDARDGLREALVQTSFQAAGIEGVKV